MHTSVRKELPDRKASFPQRGKVSGVCTCAAVLLHFMWLRVALEYRYPRTATVVWKVVLIPHNVAPIHIHITHHTCCAQCAPHKTDAGHFPGQNQNQMTPAMTRLQVVEPTSPQAPLWNFRAAALFLQWFGLFDYFVSRLHHNTTPTVGVTLRVLGRPAGKYRARPCIVRVATVGTVSGNKATCFGAKGTEIMENGTKFKATCL